MERVDHFEQLDADGRLAVAVFHAAGHQIADLLEHTASKVRSEMERLDPQRLDGTAVNADGSPAGPRCRPADSLPDFNGAVADIYRYFHHMLSIIPIERLGVSGRTADEAFRDTATSTP